MLAAIAPRKVPTTSPVCFAFAPCIVSEDEDADFAEFGFWACEGWQDKWVDFRG